MGYEIFARKYRPETFSDVVGQDVVARTLQNAVASERVAPVYIFAGSHGVGKTSMARILAKALNCDAASADAPPPCGRCETCTSIAQGRAIDVVEIDAASNRGIDEARQLRDGVYFRPASLRRKVYILDEFHQLSKEAFDALLKTFEEAPDHVVFILATTELHKVPSTIRSRSQVFQFRRATLPEVQARLAYIAEQESISISEQALELLARRSRGSLRDSQKLFDQVVALAVGEQEITADRLGALLGFSGSGRIAACVEAIASRRPAELVEVVRELYQQGLDPHVFVSDLLEAFRGLLYLQLCAPGSALLDELLIDVRELSEAARALSSDAVTAAIQMLSEAIERMRRAREERVVLELTLLRLTELANLRPIAELIARLERLEDALCKEGITPESLPPAPSGPPDNHSRSASVGEGTRAPSPSPQNDAPSPPRSKARPAVPDRAPEQNKPNAAPEQNKPNAAPEQNSTQPAPEQSSSSEPETAVAAPAPQRPAPLEARAARARLEACWESLAESCDMGLARALRQCALGSVEVLNGQLSVTLRAPSLNALLRSTLEKALSGGELATKLSAQLDAPCHIRAELPKEASKERRPEADTTPSIVNHMREAFHARLLQQTDRGFGQG